MTLTQRFDLGDSPLAIDEQPKPTRLLPQDNVLRHRQSRDEQKVLMNQSQPRRNRSLWRRNHWPSVITDRPRTRLHQAIQRVQQR